MIWTDLGLLKEPKNINSQHDKAHIMRLLENFLRKVLKNTIFGVSGNYSIKLTMDKNTSATDMKSNIYIAPVELFDETLSWSTRVSAIVGSAIHEAAHTKYSSLKELQTIPAHLKDLWNIVEDLKVDSILFYDYSGFYKYRKVKLELLTKEKPADIMGKIYHNIKGFRHSKYRGTTDIEALDLVLLEIQNKCALLTHQIDSVYYAEEIFKLLPEDVQEEQKTSNGESGFPQDNEFENSEINIDGDKLLQVMGAYTSFSELLTKNFETDFDGLVYTFGIDDEISMKTDEKIELDRSVVKTKLKYVSEDSVNINKDQDYGELDAQELYRFRFGEYNLFTQDEVTKRIKPLSICVLLDISGSMTGLKLTESKTFISYLYESVKYAPHIDVTVITFTTGNGGVKTKMNLIKKKDVLKLQTYGGNPLLESLQNLFKLYKRPANTPSLLILVSDGEVDHAAKISIQIKKLNFTKFCHISFDKILNVLNAKPCIYLDVGSPKSHNDVLKYINTVVRKETIL